MTDLLKIRQIAPERIERTTLSTMLLYWGAIQRVSGSSRKVPRPSRKTHGRMNRSQGAVLAASEGQLWDWYEHCKRVWREQIAKAHPDRGGSTELAALLNRAWARTKELFGRIGIGEGV